MPNDILLEFFVTTAGTCQIGFPEQRASSVVMSSSLCKANLDSATAATAIVSITIVKPCCLRTINTHICIVDLIPRSITMVSVMLVHGD